MKVLQINSVYHYGSTGRIVESIHKNLIKEKIPSYIIYGRKYYKDDASFFVGNRITFLTDVCLSLVMDSHGLNNKNSTRKIIEIIEKYNPDIIHIHNIHGFYANYELLFDFLAGKKIPIIITLHDCWLYTGFCAYYDFINCKEWEANCNSCKARFCYPYRLLNLNTERNFYKKKMLLEKIDNLTIVTPSSWLKKEVKKSFLKERNILVINNGINLDAFYKENTGKTIFNYGKKVLLGVASVWEKRKGLEEYEKLASKLPEEYQIVLIGISKKQSLKLNKRIICFPRTNSIDELRLFYSNAFMLLNLTLEDNFPTVNIEALACELPILTYNTGGSAEIVGDCGWIIKKRNLDDVLKCLENLNEEEYLEKKVKCRKRALNYSEYKMSRNYINLYRKIAGEIHEKSNLAD